MRSAQATVDPAACVALKMWRLCSASWMVGEMSETDRAVE